MSKRMTDERLAEIDFPFAFVSKGELYKALKAERKHWEAEDESMCDHQMRWQLMKDRIAKLETPTDKMLAAGNDWGGHWTDNEVADKEEVRQMYLRMVAAAES
jgi:hypothetical protein